MSEFVEITTSVSDILSLANGLKETGKTLATTMGHTTEAITQLENDPKTFPSDQFTDPFYRNYTTVPPGSTAPANEAVKQSLVSLGEAMATIASGVANTMWSYQGQDMENASDIAAPPAKT